ncbi:hypothetical protein AVEN_118329-1 [Araneus ventricosus]|uniref:Uncharacterized protein n=1 Tax=Araneus ventricosus TaxID=182803 RepID=A0A4Y2B6G4_ARAVE|nr:hypothetical protein AVEN_118329-1 [Araneus ventricosus]
MQVEFCGLAVNVFLLELTISINIRRSPSLRFHFRPQLFLAEGVFPFIRYVVMIFDTVVREAPAILAVLVTDSPTGWPLTIFPLSKRVSADILHSNKKSAEITASSQAVDGKITYPLFV